MDRVNPDVIIGQEVIPRKKNVMISAGKRNGRRQRVYLDAGTGTIVTVLLENTYLGNIARTVVLANTTM